MRLLLTTDTVGGVWEYTAALAHVLAEDGHALLMAVIGSPSDDQLAVLPEEIAIECRSYPLEWMSGSATELPATARWLSRLARSWGADAVHLNQLTYTAFERFAAPTLVTVHSDVCSWFSETKATAAPAEWSGYRSAVRTGLARATTVLTPTRYQSELTKRHFGRDADVVIYNGVTNPCDTPAPVREPVILSAGRAWDAGKGMADLDRAIRLLGDAAPATHVLGALEGPDGSRFQGTSVTCHGLVGSTTVHEWMSRAVVYVGPSRYEPFGLAPVEAALRGCALVLSDIGSFRELWAGAADFFPVGNADALAAKLQELWHDPTRTAALAEAARQRALACYTREQFGRRYLRLYRSLAAEGLREERTRMPRAPTPAHAT